MINLISACSRPFSPESNTTGFPATAFSTTTSSTLISFFTSSTGAVTTSTLGGSSATSGWIWALGVPLAVLDAVFLSPADPPDAFFADRGGIWGSENPTRNQALNNHQNLTSRSKKHRTRIPYLMARSKSLDR